VHLLMEVLRTAAGPAHAADSREGDPAQLQSPA